MRPPAAVLSKTCSPGPLSEELRRLLEIESVASRVTGHMAQFLTWQLSTAGPRSTDRALIHPAADFVLHDGKLLRAALCYWGWRAAGGADGEPIIAAACAIEMLHATALIHDDVMDGSATRRGRPALHAHYRDLHTRNSWRGSAEDFGAAAAILAGDLCLVWADMILNASGLSPEARRRGAPIYDGMRRDSIRGQFLDLVGQACGDAEPDLARAIALAKTASCTTVGPLLFGAELAGASSCIVAALRAYAEPLGLAFQLHDDLLDAFGDPSITGKPTGQDLRDGKATLLLALARRSGDGTTAARIEELRCIGDDAAVAELRNLIELTGARGLVEREIAMLTEKAVEALGKRPLPSEPRELLDGLARAATTHSRSAASAPPHVAAP